MRIQDIFVPNGTPTITYVDRSEHKLEQTLREHYETPNVIVSVSGPSKSGKTVLISKIVSEDRLITIAGPSISGAANLWEHALNWMGAPSQVTITKSSTTTLTASGEAGGKLKVPLVAEGAAKVTGGGSHAMGSLVAETQRNGGMEQVIKEIGGSDFAIFIDDFHHIKQELRDEIGRQIKSAAERGVKIVTASVPHRSDDVVRSNPELRGRVASVNLTYWKSEELIKIARKGFNALNAELPPAVERQIAQESFGSPQLMQTICLSLCYTLPIDKELPSQQRLDVSPEIVKEALLRTSSFADFSKMLTTLHSGPKVRGTERKLHAFTDGSQGDVYRGILLAMKSDPAELSFSYDNMLARVRSVCTNDPPVGSSITSALEQMSKLAEEVQPGSSPLSWDEDTLDVSDPYFLFYLRCSDKLLTLKT